MSEYVDEDLVRRTRALLEPGNIELNGVVVHTTLSGEEEPALHQLTLDTGNRIAAHHPDTAPEDTYVYSGNDDPEFGVNQHQGLTLDDEAFVWECQQLLREGPTPSSSTTRPSSTTTRCSRTWRNWTTWTGSSASAATTDTGRECPL
jgi:hypothetical protein